MMGTVRTEDVLYSVLKLIESAQTFFMQMKHEGLCITAS